jgi:hypothetical protein
MAMIGCGSVVAVSRVPRIGEQIAVTRFRADSAAFAVYSGVEDSLHIVIRDPTRWREYWERIHRPFIPPPPPPTIDFTRTMVILASLGRRPSLGYDILIQGAARDSAGIQVFLRRSNPGVGCLLAAAVTEPVDLATMPLSDLPIRFTELIITLPCGPR